MRDLFALLIAASLSLAPAAALASPAGSTLNERAPAQPALHGSTSAAAQRPVLTPREPKKPSAEERLRYAEREQASPEASAYRGGDTLVIGATAATAILAVLLLVVLL